MEKVENKEVKEYLVETAVARLSNCELFTKIFGKNFARKKLELNVDKVYTNEFNKKYSGYYSSEDASITLCTQQENSNLLGINEIEEDYFIQATSLHEAVHAVLDKDKLECKINGILGGTGILEFYENGTELGRGINEGLTNWIVRKTGVSTESYKHLTNLVELLELAIGEKKVMKLAKGNIKKNIARQLSMSYKECLTFLALSDELYALQEVIPDYEYIIQTLESYERKGKMEPDARAQIEKEYQDLQSNELYINTLQNDDYEQILNDINLADTILTKKAYFKGILNSKEERLVKDKDKLEEIIFTKYFEKELEKLSNNKTIPLHSILKFDNLYEYICDNLSKSSKMLNFKQEYMKLDEKYFEGIIEQAKENFRKGTLSGNKLADLEELTNRGRYVTNTDFFDKVANLVYPKDSQALKNLLCYLHINGNIANINKYAILKFSYGNTRINAYQRNGKIEAVENGYELENENMECDEIVSNMDIIKELKEKNPNSTVNMLNNLVIVRKGNSESYYIVKNGEYFSVVPETIKVSLNLDNSILQQKGSLLKKLEIGIKRKMQKKSRENMCYDVVYNDEKRTSFKFTISDRAQYSAYIPEHAKNIDSEKSEKIIKEEK